MYTPIIDIKKDGQFKRIELPARHTMAAAIADRKRYIKENAVLVNVRNVGDFIPEKRSKKQEAA